MGKLINLEYLQIWGNEITALPASMEKLENLKYLDMRTIILTTSERENLKDMFPQTEILVSPDCNCGK
jgi:Leucine-rich repeat (LRR) protein